MEQKSKIMQLNDHELIESIQSGNISVCIIGIGRIGLPTALSFANSGLSTIGIDINSKLVDMINSKDGGTSSSVLGPFHISGAPNLKIGGDLKGDFGGQLLLAQGIIKNSKGIPIKDAKVDIWQTAPNGLYSSQDPNQGTYSFHGLQTTGADGRYAFTTAKPIEYTVPSDGPVGKILNACRRHPWRPSNLHFIIKAEGYQT